MVLKFITYFFISIFFLFNTNAQNEDFDCQPYYEEFCDSIDYIPYSVKSAQNSKDSNNIDIPNCIYHLDSFCKGVQEAINEKQLSIRSVGDPHHVNPCTYYAYEKWGVKLIMTGDIIMNDGIFDENAGYNLIMYKRIKKALGNNYKELGVINEKWIDLRDDEFWKEFIETAIIANLKTDSTAHIQINTNQIKQTKFEHFDNVTFKDLLGNKTFSLEEFSDGIDVKVRDSKRKMAIIQLDFSNYQNPLFCQNHYFNKYNIPIKIAD